MEPIIEKQLDTELPPGTVRLQDQENDQIILVPTPSNDPDQPLNWSTKRKVLQMTLLCIYTTLIFATLTVTPPLWQNISDELGVSFDVLNYGYAAAYASLTVFALIFVPLSIMYGRRPVYIVTSFLSLGSVIWMANMRNCFDVIGSNLMSGIAGSVNEALFNVTICDLFFIHQRGTITGLYLFVVIVGTYLAPIASGYIAASQGWRWPFWHCAIYMGITAVAMLFFLEETKWELPPTTEPTPDSTNNTTSSKLRTYTTRLRLVTPSYPTPIPTPITARLFHHLTYPATLLILFPAVAFSALQYAWTESMLSLLAVTQADLYPLPPYNFSPIGVGNMNIAPAIGAILGAVFGGPISDYLVLRIAKRRNGVYEAEYRLWTYGVPGLSMVVGILLFGLTIAEGKPWISNAMGAAFIGFAIGACGDIALVYVQDAYDGIIGPALVGVVFVRNGMATVMTFVVPIWEASMGWFNMYVMLGVLSAVVVLTFVPLLVWGKRWRIKRGERYREMAAKCF